MKNVVALAVLLALVAAPALAGEVPQATLSSLGLGDMQVVSDAQGMQVRGMASSFGMVKGTSLIFGQLLTPDTKNFVVGSSVNEVDGNAESTAVGVMLLEKEHGVELGLSLDVEWTEGEVITSFSGMLQGIAGGVGLIQSTISP